MSAWKMPLVLESVTVGVGSEPVPVLIMPSTLTSCGS